ncbi:MAG: hypothetical protein IPK16_26440 [Anaerolineales bacterium]|nr:hypothetical protein [Anaerolineales bacterium]
MIDELADLIGAPTHMDVLFRIRKAINPAAEKWMGRPILVFEESRIDPCTGQSVPFSWWLSGAPATKPEPKRIEPEVFDEGDRFTIVMEPIGRRRGFVRATAQGDIVVIWVEIVC